MRCEAVMRGKTFPHCRFKSSAVIAVGVAELLSEMGKYAEKAFGSFLVAYPRKASDRLMEI